MEDVSAFLQQQKGFTQLCVSNKLQKGACAGEQSIGSSASLFPCPSKSHLQSCTFSSIWAGIWDQLETSLTEEMCFFPILQRLSCCACMSVSNNTGTMFILILPVSHSTCSSDKGKQSNVVPLKKNNPFLPYNSTMLFPWKPILSAISTVFLAMMFWAAQILHLSLHQLKIQGKPAHIKSTKWNVGRYFNLQYMHLIFLVLSLFIVF